MSVLPSGPVLAFDTSTSTGSVAVGTADRVLSEVTIEVRRGASGALMPAIDFAMRAAGLVPQDLAAVVVGGGPGSFTGVRVAAATAKGMVHALGIPLLAPTGLLAVAASCAGTTGSGPVCALFDARRRDVYAACYNFGSGSVREEMPPTAVSLDDLLHRFEGKALPLFTGEGALIHQDEIRRVLGAAVTPPHLSVPRAASLLWAVAHAPELGEVSDAASWEPLYARAAGAERIAAAAALQGR